MSRADDAAEGARPVPPPEGLSDGPPGLKSVRFFGGSVDPGIMCGASS